MSFDNSVLIALLVVFTLVACAWIWRHFFSEDARLERRRRRSNTRVSSTAKRPMVRFSVRVPKEKE